jgi:hypothetical protein
MQDLDTPVSLGTYLLVKYREWDQIASRRADPQHYLDTSIGAEKFRRDYQAVELLRKYEELPTTVNRKEAARAGFWSSELRCAKTNRRLDHFILHPILGPDEVRIAEFINDVKKLIRRILGPIPLEIKGRFGPGAVFESRSHPFAKSFVLGDKMELQPTTTAQGWVVCLHTMLNTAWGRTSPFLLGVSTPFADPVEGCIVRGNRFMTIPKDCTKDRGICIEPGMNVFAQLGVGRHIRRCLQRVGIDIDLTTGQEKHHALARLGSLSNSLATIDLSSASDTVSKNLVKLLLPDDWFELLSDLRSPATEMEVLLPTIRKDGKAGRAKKQKRWVLLEKFSSMGNGFTFELETLIFYALARIASGEDGREVSVYGDDIIVPTKHALDVIAVLKYFGFEPNSRKTYLSGPFRESCGGDFFCGVLVTPYRLKNEPKQPSDWISVANGLWAWSRMDLGHFRLIRRARNTALGMLPTFIRRCTGPERLGDLVVHDFKWVKRNVRTIRSIRYFRVWRPVVRLIPFKFFSPDTQMALALYGSSSSGLAPRNSVTGYRFGRVSFS